MTCDWRKYLPFLTIALSPLTLGSDLSWAATASSPQDFSCVIQSLARLAEPPGDTSVELELVVDDRVMSLLTTTDGRLGPLFQGGRRPPEWLSEYTGRVQVSGPEEIAWDMLKPADKLRLIRELSSQKSEGEFWDRREIPGLKTRDSVFVDGKTVRLSGRLMPHVQFGGPQDISNFERVELHYRTREPAGQASQNASELLRSLKIEPPHQHVHMVAPLPVVPMEQAEVEAAKKANFVARANLLSEIEAVLDRKVPVEKSMRGTESLFGYMDRDFLRELGSRLEQGFWSKNLRIGNEFKIAFVGVRGSDKYDQPGLWGVEYRAVPRAKKAAQGRRAGAILDALHASLVDPQHGLEADRMQRWLNHRSPKWRAGHWTQRMAATWYNDARVREMVEYELPEELQKLVTGSVMRKLEESSRRNQLVKALVHDWSNDPLFFDDPEAQKRILAAQKKALKLLSWNKNPGDCVRELTVFFRGSGIYERLAQSLHLETQVIK